MQWSKRVTVFYNRVEAAEDNYFSNFYDSMETMLETNNRTGTFESGELMYQWELLEKIDTDKTPMYLFSLVKERPAWPVLFTENGRTELAIPEGSLGEISYGLFCPAYTFLLSFAAGSGGSVTQFKKLLGQFSPEGIVRFNPVFEENVDDKVLQWDSYKKVSISLKMPTGEDVANFQNTKAGEMMKLLGHLGGLKLDIAVSSLGSKETLSTMMVKDLLPELLANDLCTSLTVKGSDFENAESEQFDLKNAQIKYTEQMEIEGNYITDSDAKQVIMRALNERASLLFSESWFNKLEEDA